MCKLKKFLSVFLSLSLVTSASVQQNAFAATPNDGKCWEQKFNEVDKGSNSIFYVDHMLKNGEQNCAITTWGVSGKDYADNSTHCVFNFRTFDKLTDVLDWDRREFDELRNEASAKKTLGARFSLLKSLLSESLGNKFAFSKKEKNPNLAITNEDKKWIKECLLDHITKFVDRAKTQAGEDYQVPFDALNLRVFKDSDGRFRFRTLGAALGIHYTDAEKRTFMQKLKKLAEDLKNSLMERENVLLECLKLQFGDVNASLIEAELRKIRGTDEYKNKLLKEKEDRNLDYERGLIIRDFHNIAGIKSSYL